MPEIYCADTWCDSCAAKIREDILASCSEEAAARFCGSESDYDSDEFPKCIGDDEESDCPQHCASYGECLEAETLPSGKIGALLGTSLTDYGVEYVKQAVAKGGEVAEFWRERFDWIDFQSDDDEE